MGEKEKEKVTIMVLKVDLQCEKCYRKVKKVLCKFPQIRDQTYNEKNNEVIIKVVCCSPEKIRDKLCCKGGGTIKNIDIKPFPVPEPKEVEKKDGQKKPSPEKKTDPLPTEKDNVKKTNNTKTVKSPAQAPESTKSALAPEPTKSALTAALVPAYPVYPLAPVNASYMDFNGGHPGGPCQSDYGYGVPAPYVQYDGYYGRPVYDSYSGGSSYNTSSYCVTRPDYFSEENPQACVIM